MKGITNATKGAADVVQDDTKVSVLSVDLQEATDSQPGLMSKASHKILSTTVTRVGTCEGDISALQTGKADTSTVTTLQTTVAGKQDKLTAGTNITISGNTISASGGSVTAGEGISVSGSQVSLKSVHSGYNSVGGSTYAPQFNVDKYGRVTSVSETRVYPPTTAGTSGQVWTSTGSGSGEWATISTVSPITEVKVTATRYFYSNGQARWPAIEFKAMWNVNSSALGSRTAKLNVMATQKYDNKYTYDFQGTITLTNSEVLKGSYMAYVRSSTIVTSTDDFDYSSSGLIGTAASIEASITLN